MIFALKIYFLNERKLIQVKKAYIYVQILSDLFVQEVFAEYGDCIRVLMDIIDTDATFQE